MQSFEEWDQSDSFDFQESQQGRTMAQTLEELYEELENARGGGNQGDIENAWAAICDHQQRKLIDGIRAVQELMANSEGVCGLHRNGDIATWDELSSGGRFEGWLSAFDEAVEVADTIAPRRTPAAACAGR